MNDKELLVLANELENQRGKAMVDGNVEELKNLLSEDLFYGHSGGFSDDLNSFTGKLASGFAKYHSVTTTIHQVVPLGEHAMTLNGKVIVEATINGVPYKLHCIYVGVWKLENKKWKFVAHQSAKLPEPV